MNVFTLQPSQASSVRVTNKVRLKREIWINNVTTKSTINPQLSLQVLHIVTCENGTYREEWVDVPTHTEHVKFDPAPTFWQTLKSRFVRKGL